MQRYLLFILAILISCKKSSVTIPPPIAVLLTSMKYTAPNGTGFTMYYDHDTNNRLTNIRYAGINIPLVYSSQGLLVSYGSPVAYYQPYIKFYYDNNGNLTSALAKSYDNLGVAQDSVRLICTITNGQVSQIKEYDLTSANPTAIAYIYSNTYDINNNLVKQVIVNNSGTVLETDTYTFGTNHSPQFTNHFKYNLNVLLDNDYFNNNEILSETSTSIYSNIQTFPSIFQYGIYDQSYPISEAVLNGALSGNYFYTYTGLDTKYIQ